MVDVAPLSVRAEVGSVDEADRSVEVIWSTGADVMRADWFTGQKYVERLSLDPTHIRLDRLNAGAPLLDAHSSYSVSSLLGSVAPGSVRLEKRKAVARVRFSKRADVEPIWGDVQDGHIRFVSVGYRVHRFDETPGKGKDALPIRTAVDWEPYEISMVPMPADAGAKVRGTDRLDTNPCVIVRANPDADRLRHLRLAQLRAS